MEIKVEPGKYVVAVSGGVDSVVLLDLLSKLPRLELVVAHFDHGIREESKKDSVFVQELAKRYGFMFICERRELGQNASEELARNTRYTFLTEVKTKYAADYIITAHHKDDVLETALINIYRGTGRRGITSLRSGNILRPLLDSTKQEIVDYANKQNLEWREDNTNTDEKYLRNKIRKLLDKDEANIKLHLEVLVNKFRIINKELDALLNELITDYLSREGDVLDRLVFIMLPYKISCEVLWYWLSEYDVRTSRKNIERLVAGVKTTPVGSQLDIGGGKILNINTKDISLDDV